MRQTQKTDLCVKVNNLQYKGTAPHPAPLPLPPQKERGLYALSSILMRIINEFGQAQETEWSIQACQLTRERRRLLAQKKKVRKLAKQLLYRTPDCRDCAL